MPWRSEGNGQSEQYGHSVPVESGAQAVCEVATPLCPFVCPLSVFVWCFKMKFIERGESESLAEHLLRNADALVLSQEHRDRLLHAFRLTNVTCADKRTQAAYRSEGHRQAELVSQELAVAMADLTTAAKARREKVANAGDGEGPLRISARDGLGSLALAKSLTDVELRDALAYRVLYEFAGKGAGLGSQLEDRPKAVRSTSHGAVAFGLHRAYVGVRLTGIETAVASADASGRALTVLRAVAGDGHTIRSLGGGGDTKRKNLEALRLALRVVRAAILTGGYGLRGRPPGAPDLALYDVLTAPEC